MIGSGAQARRNMRRLMKKIGETCEQFDKDMDNGYLEGFTRSHCLKELEKRIQQVTFEFIKDGKKIG